MATAIASAATYSQGRPAAARLGGTYDNDNSTRTNNDHRVEATDNDAARGQR
jgi:hypothetical protein